MCHLLLKTCKIVDKIMQYDAIIVILSMLLARTWLAGLVTVEFNQPTITLVVRPATQGSPTPHARLR